MKIEFLKQFSKDLDNLSDAQVKRSVLNVILSVEVASSLQEISNVKKLKGHRSAFRIRVGDYRVGVFVKTDTTTFARVVHRKDIYKIFP